MIESLTQAQKDRLPEFREKWLKIGLCTEPANRKEAEEAIKKSYILAELAPPERIVWCDSPIDESFAYNSAKSAVTHSGKIVSIFVKYSAYYSVRDSISTSIRDSAWSFIKDSVWNFVRDSVWNSVAAFVGNSIRSSPCPFCYGQHDAGWLSTYDYLREVVGLRKETEKLTGLIEVAKHAGWWAPYEKVCFVSERHNFLSLDGRGRLHSLLGPAITYPDGWKIYAVHGVTVPSWMIEEKPLITVAKIESEANAEVRRVMTEIYGHERYIRDSGAELVAQDELGELYRKSVANDEPLVMVKVINSTPELDGTSKEYWLRVNPELRPLLGDGQLGNAQEATARNAIASTFGKYGQEYIVSRQT